MGLIYRRISPPNAPPTLLHTALLPYLVGTLLHLNLPFDIQLVRIVTSAAHFSEAPTAAPKAVN